MNFGQAEKSIRTTWLLSAIAIPVFFGYVLTGKGAKYNLQLLLPWVFPVGPHIFDCFAILFLVLILAFMVFRRSRIGAVLLLFEYILNRYYTIMWLYFSSSAFIITWLCVSVVWGLLFLQGMRGTFVYHRLKGKMSVESLDKPIPVRAE